MKKCILLTLFLIPLICSTLHGQVKNNSIFLEAFGNGGVISLNYERLISSRIGIRAGIGTMAIVTTYPITATYRIGSGNSQYELGGGIVILSTNEEDRDDESFLEDILEKMILLEGAGTFVIGTALFGYRYTADWGFLFRTTFTPFFNDQGFTIYGGVSIGYSF